MSNLMTNIIELIKTCAAVFTMFMVLAAVYSNTLNLEQLYNTASDLATISVFVFVYVSIGSKLNSMSRSKQW